MRARRHSCVSTRHWRDVRDLDLRRAEKEKRRDATTHVFLFAKEKKRNDRSSDKQQLIEYASVAITRLGAERAVTEVNEVFQQDTG